MKIIWTDNAIKSIEEIIEDIIYKFSIKEAEKFYLKVEDFTNDVLSNYKLIGKKHDIYRKFVLTKQTSVFYRIDEKKEVIYLVLFWLNKRDPKTLRKILGL